MKKLGIVLVFGVGVGVGCAAGTAVQPRVAEAQAPEAQSPEAVTRWEYKCVAMPAKGTSGANYAEKVQGIADDLGSAGWEACTDPGTVWCFKRPLP
jgi:hypothetical protein